MTSPLAPECCVITPVEDRERYERCLLRNPATAGCLHVMLQTAPGDPTLAARCNAFLDAYNYERPTWFLFCREQFEPKDSVRDVLIGANRAHLYHSPARPAFAHFPTSAGGLGALFVHADLLARSTLRFDESLVFGAGLDAFCAQAAILGIPVERLALQTVDYSCRESPPPVSSSSPTASSCRYRRPAGGMQWIIETWHPRRS